MKRKKYYWSIFDCLLFYSSQWKLNVFFVKFTAELVSFWCIYPMTSSIKEPMYIKFHYKNKKETKTCFLFSQNLINVSIAFQVIVLANNCSPAPPSPSFQFTSVCPFFDMLNKHLKLFLKRNVSELSCFAIEQAFFTDFFNYVTVWVNKFWM